MLIASGISQSMLKHPAARAINLKSQFRTLYLNLSRMESNKAAFLDEAGKPFRIDSAPIPVPGPNDIVIRNHAIAINPLDYMQWSKGVLIKTFPAVLGSDVAGEVFEVGSNVSRFKKGDSVVGHTWGLLTGKSSDAAFALYSCLPAGSSAIIPKQTEYRDAAVLPMAIDTATSGLFQPDTLNLSSPHESTESSGGTVLVYGGSSSVGSMAIQLASAAGYRVLAIASERNADLIMEAGAAELFDYHDNDVVEQILQTINKSSFVGVFDAIGNDSSHAILVPILERLGGASKYVTTKATPENLPKNVQSKRMFGVGEFSFPIWRDFVSRGLESGRLECLPRSEVVGHGLESLQSAVERIGEGVSGKKLVVEL